jgi:16S rRNA (cytosine1402-N4)-methyltransferase
METVYHTPVLLDACIEGLNLKPGGVYADLTLGGGGHSRAILEKMEGGRLLGFDQDPDAWANAPADERFVLVKGNFRHLRNFLKAHNAWPVDGILADLGISSHQIDAPERGFALRFDARLDMRMNPAQALDAYTVVNTYSEDALGKVLRVYGEMPMWHRLSQAIAEARMKQPIETTGQLKQLALPFVRGKREPQLLAQLFQAIRLEVNQELQALEAMLVQALEALKSGGRLVVLTYHSLEDRLVKHFLKTGNLEGRLEEDGFGNKHRPFLLITRKSVVADAAEVASNPRARSARLRIGEKI